MSVRQSVCLPMLKPRDMSLDMFCARCAELGIDAVEIWRREEDFENIVATAKKHNLGIAGFIGHGTLRDGLNKIENHDRIEAELRASINVAADHGVPGVICFAGNRNPGQSDLQGMINCANGLRRVMDYAEKKAVNLNLELLNSKVDHPGFQCDHTQWGVALCEMVGSPRVKLLFDIYHMQIMEGDLIRTIQNNIRYIGHFHTAGNPGRSNLDDAQEIHYASVFRAIDETGYDGFIGHEFKPDGDALIALKQAVTLCDVAQGTTHV